MQQVILVATMVLSSKGAAGVPGFAILILSATLASAGLPLDAVALIAGIFRIIDSGTTTLNVLGNVVAPLVINRWEKKAPLLMAHEQSSIRAKPILNPFSFR